MNKVILRGNVGQDPTITYFDNGGKVAQFTLATTERGHKTKDGREIPDVTDWHNIVVRQAGLAGVVEQYVKKGTPLLVCGKVRTREWADLAAYITEQREARKAAIASYNAMKKAGGAIGLKLPAHPIDETMDWTVEQFAVEYLAVIGRASKRPVSVRRYVEQLAQQAYNVTVAQIVCEEFPELTTVFFPAPNGQN